MTALLTDNLPLLAGAPNGIKKLRELILELAVRGKLVPQDPSDEPASELLRRIAEEKARLVAEGKIKKQKPLTERDDEAPEIELPAGWAWARLSNVVNVLNGRAYKKEELLDAGTPVLRVGNLFTSNHWYHSNLTLEEDKYCNPGDLLFAWSASFGPFIWQGERSIYHYHIWKHDRRNAGAATIMLSSSCSLINRAGLRATGCAPTVQTCVRMGIPALLVLGHGLLDQCGGELFVELAGLG